MGVSLPAATWLLDVVLSIGASAPLARPEAQQGTTLVQRGYEPLPDSRWREELLRDERFRFGTDSWLTDRLYPDQAWVPDVSRPELDLRLEVERFTARGLPVYRPVRLVMPYRPDDSGLFDDKHPTWEKVVGGFFYGAAFVDAMSEAVSEGIRGALGSNPW